MCGVGCVCVYKSMRACLYCSYDNNDDHPYFRSGSFPKVETDGGDHLSFICGVWKCLTLLRLLPLRRQFRGQNLKTCPDFVAPPSLFRRSFLLMCVPCMPRPIRVSRTLFFLSSSYFLCFSFFPYKD